ncbi:MAG: DUF2723 domain-containing protein [Anaerolineae bacterium]|nr:DUF2723 domain-containing protein [Anaerolineae bacterium]
METTRPANQPTNQLTNQLSRLVPFVLFVLAFTLYAATAAPGTIFGDPSEYQFVPAIPVIAHPPGYAFYTLLARLWQMAVPLGTIAYRTNLLAAAAGAWAVTAVYLTTYNLQSLISRKDSILAATASSAFAALSIAVTPNLWQHAIHANAHVVSAALTATHLWLLASWWRTKNDRWLVAFALVIGLSVTHHPITLMGGPAYGLFILLARFRILRQWRLLLVLTTCFLIGLTPLLYFPLRSPNMPPGFQPTDMNTWEGFVNHVTAKGLRVNFGHFGLADQPARIVVLWSLLRLQFPLPALLLTLLGLIGLTRRAPKAAALLGLFVLVHVAFTINFYQDIMAYLLNPFAALAILAGLGTIALAELFTRQIRTRPAARHLLFAICYLLFLVFPIFEAALNLQHGISLRDFTAPDDYVAALYQRFAGRGEGAVILSDWEHLTPLLVHTQVYGEGLDEADVKKVVYVNPTDGPTWVRNVWENAEEGPTYVVGYRPALRDEGLRLIPDGPFYRVLLPAAFDGSPSHALDVWADDRVHVSGYDLPATSVHAGEPLRLVLYQSVTEPLEAYWMPYARLGPFEARWTTDSRLNTPQWQPGETVVEEYELPVPFDLPPGEYPLSLGYADLSGGRPELILSSGETTVELATITVLPPPPPLSPPCGGVKGGGILANLDNQVALMGASARAGLQIRQANWEKPLVVQPGQVIYLTLTWRGLSSPRDSYTVFIHLMDAGNRPVEGVNPDDTPLGGSFPTYLWFPKWLPGQTVDDPYRLQIPPDLPPGDYYLEAGMYGMTSHRRLPVVNLAELTGDRVILGPVQVK